MAKLLITGTGGFIGTCLLEEISNENYEQIYCLYRSARPELRKQNGVLQFIQADILDSSSYASYLTDCDTVVHLAAATGKRMKDEYYAVNTKGTEALLEQCRRAGVKNILFVSTIAVTYPDKFHYDYAISKEQAEESVMNSGLNYAIVRPTIVLGSQSPLWNNLSRMAKGRIIPYFGDGRTNIQPIHVLDLVRYLQTILDDNLFSNNVYELGGPDILTFDEFLNAIHHEYTGTDPRIVHIPYRPVRSTLVILEGLFYKILPISVGQLSAFNNEGTIQPNALHSKHAHRTKTVNEIIKELVHKEPVRLEASNLKGECIIFTEYLIGEKPSDYIVDKYIQAHSKMEVFNGDGAGSFDHFLARMAARNRFNVRLADSYASIFFKNSLLRRKLILLLAILESCSPYTRHFELPDSSSTLGIGGKIILRGIVFSTTFALACMLLIPARIVMSKRSKPVAEVGETWAR